MACAFGLVDSFFGCFGSGLSAAVSLEATRSFGREGRASAFGMTLLGPPAGFEGWEGLFLGGLLVSTFSWVLHAELAVGRIILARKPSSTALDRALLAREAGRSLRD